MELSRRDFLKASAGATALLLMQPAASAMAQEASSEEALALLVDVTKCGGCWRCYAACKHCHDLPETARPDPEQAPQLSPVVWTTLQPVKRDDRWHTRKQACNHCTDATCVKVCPTGALSHNSLGFVQYDPGKCSGCGYCAEFCPFGVPKLETKPDGTSLMSKCTFCEERVTHGEKPACAAACPTGAIRFGRQSALLKEGTERVAALRTTNDSAVLYGQKELGGLHVMYVLDDQPEAWGLPADPEVPAPAIVRDVLQWVGVGAGVAAVAGFGLNYVIAREAKLASELPGKEFQRKSKGEKKS